jgi:hypothetical protein
MKQTKTKWVIKQNYIKTYNGGDKYYPVDVNVRTKGLTEEENKDLVTNGIKFRILDDDGIVYYEGYSNNSSSFSPLDSYAKSDGCTDIQYFENGQWNTL